MSINGNPVSVAWEKNDSVEGLKKLTESQTVTIKMSKYGGFEQFGPIGSNLPSNDIPITTSAGDIVLYDNDKMVIFYGSNTWEYTRLGKIRGMTAIELRVLLGGENVTITLASMECPTVTKITGLKSGKKSLYISWKKRRNITGYQIQYSTKKSFRDGKTVTMQKSSTTGKKITGLKEKTTYYVRIRTYQTVNGQKYYSEWSGAKKVKTK